MLALHDKSIVVHHVAMENDLFVGVKLEEYVDNVICFINIKYRKLQMGQIRVSTPFNIDVIEVV
jgi:hypothetical protein